MSGEKEIGIEEAIANLDRLLLLPRPNPLKAALTLGRETLSRIGNEFGDNHPLAAKVYSSIGSAQRALRNFDEAIVCHEKAYRIRAAALGTSHPLVSESLHNLGVVCIAKQDWETARSHLEKALRLRGWGVLGKADGGYLRTMVALATVHVARKDCNEASRVVDDAGGVLEAIKQFAKQHEHPRHLIWIANLLKLSIDLGRFELAKSLDSHFAALMEESLQYSQSELDETERLDHIATWRLFGDLSLWLHRSLPMPDWKAVFNRLASLSAPSLKYSVDHCGVKGDSPHAANIVKAREEYAAAALTLSDRMTSAELQRIAERLREAESEITRAYRSKRSRRDASDLAKQLSMLLHEKSAFILFYHSRHLFNSPGFDEDGLNIAGKYFAFVVRRGAEPLCIELGGAADLDLSIATLRKELSRQQERLVYEVGQDFLSISADPSFPADEDRWQRSAAAIAREILTPLKPHLEGTTELIFCPDGRLWTVPFGLLPVSDSELLVDRYRTRLVNALEEVWNPPAGFGTGGTPVVIAAPKFKVRKATEWSKGISFFPPLPHAENEGIEVARFFDVEPIMGTAATKASVRAVKNPRVLHLATHGFSLGTVETHFRQFGGYSWISEAVDRDASSEKLLGGLLPQAALSHPLLSAGLALSGAADWVDAVEIDKCENGILSAFEVRDLDLIGTELVVLSGCETGLGDVVIGEGVLGLRRAFMQAGAAAVISTLWKVSDRATMEFMRQFYTSKLSGHSISHSLRAAQLRLRSEFPHPRDWAPFQLTGFDVSPECEPTPQ